MFKQRMTEQKLFKLMNNVLIGKTIVNIRKHSIVYIVNKWDSRKGTKNLIVSPSFHYRTIFIV